MINEQKYKNYKSINIHFTLNNHHHHHHYHEKANLLVID